MKFFKYIKSNIKDFKDFLKSLIGSSTGKSHKRFISLGSFFVLVLIALLNQIFSLKIDTTFIYVFAGLAGWQSGLSTIENLKKK